MNEEASESIVICSDTRLEIMFKFPLNFLMISSVSGIELVCIPIKTFAYFSFIFIKENISLAFDEAHGKLMWLLRAPAVTARLETDFLKPVPMGSTLHISAKITGQVKRKVYSSAEGRLDTPDGPLAVRAAALFVIVPMDHFLNNAPKEYLDHIAKSPEILAFVDPDFEINP